MTKAEFKALLMPLIDAAAAMDDPAERAEFWKLVNSYISAAATMEIETGVISVLRKAIDISTDAGIVQLADESDISDNVKEATRRIRIIFSPYSGRDLTEGMKERIKADSEKVLAELGVDGRIDVRENGVLFSAHQKENPNEDHDSIFRGLLAGTDRDYMVALDTLMVLLMSLAAPQRDIELRKLTSYLKRRTGEIANKYDVY